MSTNAIHEEVITHTIDGVTYEGFLAHPVTTDGKFNTVILVPDAFGVREHTQNIARKLAALGYLGVNIDLFGKGIRPKTIEEARPILSALLGDRATLRARANSWVELIRNHPRSTGEIVTAGYCFGGTTSLEIARSGTKLRGAASFHGGLDTPNRSDANNIKCPIVVYHGQIDPFISDESVAAFHKEMIDAKVDYQFISFGLAVHAFTVPHVIRPGAAEYHEASDKRSWGYFVQFLAEVFSSN